MALIALPVTAFVGALLVLIPLPSHWRARNYATVSLVFWLFVINLIYGINSTIWNDNISIRLLVWCDITTKFIIGASAALPATAMCICKHLEAVASGRIVYASHGDRQRRMFFELAMCFVLPVVIMALHYIVQGHRFDIIEGFGCQPTTYYSIPGVFIVWFPPLLLATVSMIYAILALYHFIRHRVTFAAVLRNASSSITPNRYLRLMALAITQVIWQIVLTSLPMYDNIALGLRPWTNWADVHSDWLRVDQYPLDSFVPAYRTQLFLFFFVMPASSLLFLSFFGFGEQAVKEYRQSVDWVRCKVFRLPPYAQKTPPKGMKLSSGVALPSPHVYSIPHFVSDDRMSLPAYSPPGDRSHFAGTFKTLSKEEVDELHLSTLSLDNVTIPTVHTGELSSITVSDASFSSEEAEPNTPHEIRLPAQPPSIAFPRSPESPPSERSTRPPPSPRVHMHVSHFSTDSDIADIA
ncbi:STE3-domain-containing protein [Dichomitus squalens]|uniref:STE3-domain-containing protein n=1 Tax=Dichomitus squalens TaxID=114155 RepID=A0A4Q9PP98_9APHY|nr:STE3-domain-containing protein [Dichomitus squalens]